ncbi:MAG: hypothetical protein IRZ05_11075 [Micromonosporaceae bacterium]|jgi:hypothetical protein|nr:hypothetical protein [Micromonosporaceae bacterium]
MLIDCDSCVVRGTACGGCVVSVMLGAPPAGVELDEAERRALEVLADAGVVPHLRLVTPESLDAGDGSRFWPTGKGERRRLRHIA